MKNSIEINKEEVLLNKVTDTVLDNLDNDQFGVEELSSLLGLSRSHLHRKLKLLKGQSVSQFIREIRLKEAMKLLKNNGGNSSEVAIKVGFNSSSYFNKCFNERYGYSPGEILKDKDLQTKNKRKAKSFPHNFTRQPNYKFSILGVFLSIVVILLALGWGIFNYNTSNVAIGERKSIAILPLDHLSEGEEQKYLAGAMQDALIGELGKISGLRVVSRTSTLKYPESNMLIQDIARELDVDLVVEGSIYQNEDSLRLQIQLIEVFPKENHLWTQEYFQNISSVLSIQNNLIQNIAREIDVKLTNEEQEQLNNTRQINPEAYKNYVRGAYYVNKSTPEDFEKGLLFLNKAIENDPADPLAYAKLALGYVTLGHGPNPTLSYWQRGKAAALKAIELDSTLAEAHATLAFFKLYYEWDWEGAGKGFAKAIKLNPNMADVYFHYAWYNILMGREEEAITAHERAKELDPLTPIYTADLGGLYLWIGRNDEALREIDLALELDPEFSHAWWAKGNVYNRKGLHKQALEAHQKALEIGEEWLWAVGGTYAFMGETEKINEIIEVLKENVTTRNAFGLAYIYTILKDYDQAFYYLNIKPADPWIPFVRVWPEFEFLRQDPRFKDFITKLSLPPVT